MREPAAQGRDRVQYTLRPDSAALDSLALISG